MKRPSDTRKARTLEGNPARRELEAKLAGRREEVLRKLGVDRELCAPLVPSWPLRP